MSDFLPWDDLQFREMTPIDRSSYLDTRSTPFGQYLGAKIETGFDYTTPKLATDYANLMMHGDLPADSPDGLDETTWKASSYYRKGMSFPGDKISKERAQALADYYDERAWRDYLVEHRASGILSGTAGFLGAVSGGLPDPVNFIPIFGWGAKGVAVAKALAAGASRDALKAAFTTASKSAFEQATARYGVLGAHTLRGAIDATGGNILALPPSLVARSDLGEHIDASDVLTELVLAASAGAIIGGAVGFRPMMRERRLRTFNDVMANLDEVRGKLNDTARQIVLDQPLTWDNRLRTDLESSTALRDRFDREGVVRPDAAPDAFDIRGQIAELQARAAQPDRFAKADRLRADLTDTEAQIEALRRGVDNVPTSDVITQLDPATGARIKAIEDELNQPAVTTQRRAELQQEQATLVATMSREGDLVQIRDQIVAQRQARIEHLNNEVRKLRDQLAYQTGRAEAAIKRVVAARQAFEREVRPAPAYIPPEKQDFTRMVHRYVAEKMNEHRPATGTLREAPITGPADLAKAQASAKSVPDPRNTLAQTADHIGINPNGELPEQALIDAIKVKPDEAEQFAAAEEALKKTEKIREAFAAAAACANKG